MFKKFVSTILIFTILSFSVVGFPFEKINKSEAVVYQLATNPTVQRFVVSMLVACGIEFPSADEAVKVAQNTWDSFTDDVKQEVVDTVSLATALGVTWIDIQDSRWNPVTEIDNKISFYSDMYYYLSAAKSCITYSVSKNATTGAYVMESRLYYQIPGENYSFWQVGREKLGDEWYEWVRIIQEYTGTIADAEAYFHIQLDEFYNGDGQNLGVLTNRFCDDVGISRGPDIHLPIIVSDYYYTSWQSADLQMSTVQPLYNSTPISLNNTTVEEAIDDVRTQEKPAIGADVLDPVNEVTVPYAGETAGEVVIPDTTTEVGLLEGVINTLNDVRERLANILNYIAELIAGLATAISDEIASLFNSWFPKVPDGIRLFFPNLLALILALLALFAKGIAFITEIAVIPASSAWLNADVVRGIDWAKNLSYNGINIYGTIMALTNLLLGLLVFKQLRKLVYGGATVVNKTIKKR